MKAKEAIKNAFIELGILVAGAELATDDLAWATTKFNSFLKTKGVDALNIQVEINESFAMTSGVNTYTIGTGGDFDTIRPNTIQKAFVRDSLDNDYPIDIRPIDAYWDIQTKDTDGRPIELFYQREFPLGKIYLYYTPDTADDLHLISYKPFATYTVAEGTAGTDDIILPGEYEEMFITNFALRIAPRYGRTPPRDLVRTANETLQGIRGDNLAKNMTGVRVNYIRGRRTYNINEGY